MGPEIGPELFGTVSRGKLNGVFDKVHKSKANHMLRKSVTVPGGLERKISHISSHCTVRTGVCAPPPPRHLRVMCSTWP